MKKTVLIIDDDERLRDLLDEYLRGYGYGVLTLPDGLAAVETIVSRRPDIVVLDVMLPVRDGLDVLRAIRAALPTPVIMLTAKGEDADRIVGLELGADDYLSKPFNPRELLARIRAVLRRGVPSAQSPDASSVPQPQRISIADLTLDTGRHTLCVGQHEFSLSTNEYKILHTLMLNPDKVLTRDELMNLSLGKDYEAFDRSIDVYMSKLRSLLKWHPDHGDRIKTVWGTGYMFVGVRR
ncbi:MAG: two-component system OmpR family phosphate regulon response regulator OmpR [Rhodospirillaceae bacterium]|nr:MAG: two-component system OmpR family phosphate regulon response regulator OmpR [Rhodospirillaceae bacterium]